MFVGYRRGFGAAAVVAVCGLSSLLVVQNGRAAEQAETILQTTGVQGGLVVHLGCADGQLTANLCKNDRFVVQGLERDPKLVDSARQHVDSLDRYGRVSVRQWLGTRLPYGDNLVNLLVISSEWSVDQDEVKRVLRPGGVAVTLDADQQPQKPFRKPVPGDIDQWTHYLHDSGNNAVAEDDRVGPPRHLQWKSGPTWCRSHEFSSSVQAMVSANGRLIGVIDEGIVGQPRGVPEFWTLIARDAFNGILLWERPCSRINPHALVAIGDRVFITLQGRGPLSILDAATGETLHTCPDIRESHRPAPPRKSRKLSMNNPRPRTDPR